MSGELRDLAVSEAAAPAYGVAGVEVLRGRLEEFDGWLRPERHRVVEGEHEGERVLCLELWVRDYSDIRARWEARWHRRPHPPTQYMWLTQLEFPVEREWTEAEIEEALEQVAEHARAIEWSQPLVRSPDPPPPGYEDTDYDQMDWLMDMKHQLWWRVKV